MKDLSRPRIYILSAYRADASQDENHLATCDLHCDLAGEDYPFQACEGSYEGVTEESFIITGADAESTVAKLAVIYRQESYLVSTEHNRDTYLVDPLTGYHEHIGTLTCIGAEHCEPLEGDWTLVNGVYYGTVVKGRLVDLEGGL